MPTKKWEYHISSYQLTEKHLIGHTQAERSHYDLLRIVLVCLGSKSHRQLKGILRLLNMLLLDNLSEGIERRGERRGENADVNWGKK